jgi:hypothetical protein
MVRKRKKSAKTSSVRRKRMAKQARDMKVYRKIRAALKRAGRTDYEGRFVKPQTELMRRNRKRKKKFHPLALVRGDAIHEVTMQRKGYKDRA